MRRSTAWVLIGVGAGALGAAWLLGLSAPAYGGQPESPKGRSAVVALTAAAPEAALASVPADFRAEFGYEPQVRGGLVVAPGGSCSSPVPLPADFEPACAQHDLGYDLLRYADRAGQPLSPWAREAVDQQLGDALRQICQERADAIARSACLASAGVAESAVGVNTWRQGGGVPGPETAATGGAMGAAGIGLAALGSAAVAGSGWVCRQARSAPLAAPSQVVGGAAA